MRLWLLAYPHHLGRDKKVDFGVVLEAQDKEAIIQAMVDRKLNEVTYGPPSDWFKYLKEIVKLGVPAKDEIDRFAEAKATRDILVHNRGIANKTYESKAGKLARYKFAERIEIPGDYYNATSKLIRKMIADISTAALERAS